jgi:hypothetical protein
MNALLFGVMLASQGAPTPEETQPLFAEMILTASSDNVLERTISKKLRGVSEEELFLSIQGIEED